MPSTPAFAYEIQQVLLCKMLKMKQAERYRTTWRYLGFHREIIQFRMLLKTAKNTSVKQRGEIILIFGSSFQSDSVSLAVVIQKNIFLITDFQSDLESGAALTQNSQEPQPGRWVWGAENQW